MDEFADKCISAHGEDELKEDNRSFNQLEVSPSRHKNGNSFNRMTTDAGDAACPSTAEPEVFGTDSSLNPCTKDSDFNLGCLSGEALFEMNRWTRRRLEEILDGLILDVSRWGWSSNYNKRIEAVKKQLGEAVFDRDGVISPELLWCEMRSSFVDARSMTEERSEKRSLDARRRHEEALESTFWKEFAAFAKELPDDESVWTEFAMVSSEVYDDVTKSVKQVSRSMSWLLGSQENPCRDSPRSDDEIRSRWCSSSSGTANQSFVGTVRLNADVSGASETIREHPAESEHCRQETAKRETMLEISKRHS